MIVYQCNSKDKPIRQRRYVKMRVSDKNKRWYDKFYKRRGANSYWWKEVE